MSILTLGAVRAASRRRPGSASMPAREPPARVRPVGPRPRVLGPRPGIAWGRLVHVSTPTRAVGSTRRSSARHPSQCPEAHRPSAPSQYPIPVTARRLVSRRPSQCPEAHGPSVPRARLDAPWRRWAACLPSQAERPAYQPAGSGSPAERFSACPGRPPGPQRLGILHRATASARYRSRPRPAPPPLGGSGTGQHNGHRVTSTSV